MASGLGMQGDQITKEDVRRVEHEESAGHKAGNIPAGSDAAAMQVRSQLLFLSTQQQADIGQVHDGQAEPEQGRSH